MASLMGDLVNTQMLGMSKAVSDDSARRALKKMAISGSPNQRIAINMLFHRG
jgi:hypothetical protein